MQDSIATEHEDGCDGDEAPSPCGNAPVSCLSEGVPVRRLANCPNFGADKIATGEFNIADLTSPCFEGLGGTPIKYSMRRSLVVAAACI